MENAEPNDGISQDNTLEGLEIEMVAESELDASATLEEETIMVFECDFDGCGYICDRQDNMKRHKRQTHEDVRQACSICGKLFRPTSMKRHVDKIHKSKLSKPLAHKAKSSNPLNKQLNDKLPNEFKVETIVKLRDDGTIEYTSNPIKIGNVQFILVPQILDGKFVLHSSFVHYFVLNIETFNQYCRKSQCSSQRGNHRGIF